MRSPRTSAIVGLILAPVFASAQAAVVFLNATVDMSPVNKSVMGYLTFQNPARIANGDQVSLTVDFLGSEKVTIRDHLASLEPLLLSWNNDSSFVINNAKVNLLGFTGTGGAVANYSLGTQSGQFASLGPILHDFLTSGQSATFSGFRTSFDVQSIAVSPQFYRSLWVIASGGATLKNDTKPPSKNFGLFIGSLDPGSGFQKTARSDLMAARLATAFDSLPNTTAVSLLGDLRKNDSGVDRDPVTKSEILDSLSLIRKQMQTGDTLTLYIGGHGGSAIKADDLTSIEESLARYVAYGDEYVHLGDNISDNWLADALKPFDDFKKMTFIESCHSGGFWGSGDSTEVLGSRDLDLLKNIALYTSSSETGYSVMGEDGLGFFGLALESAWKSGKNLSGSALYDYIEDVSEELASFPYYSNPYYFGQDVGDPLTANPALISTHAFFSTDFDPQAPLLQIPEPTTLAVLGLGLAGLAASSRRKQ